MCLFYLSAKKYNLFSISICRLPYRQTTALERFAAPALIRFAAIPRGIGTIRANRQISAPTLFGNVVLLKLAEKVHLPTAPERYHFGAI
jgi:hypothetical protein